MVKFIQHLAVLFLPMMVFAAPQGFSNGENRSLIGNNVGIVDDANKSYDAPKIYVDYYKKSLL